MFLFSQSVFFYFILFTLLLACTGNLVPRAVDWGKSLKAMTSSDKEKLMPYVIALDVALVRKLFLLLARCEAPFKLDARTSGTQRRGY